MIITEIDEIKIDCADRVALSELLNEQQVFSRRDADQGGARCSRGLSNFV
jgi:hypothetical protein